MLHIDSAASLFQPPYHNDMPLMDRAAGAANTPAFAENRRDHLEQIPVTGRGQPLNPRRPAGFHERILAFESRELRAYPGGSLGQSPLNTSTAGPVMYT
jgi:hypothetical protein